MTPSTRHDILHPSAHHGGPRGHLHQLAAGGIFGVSIQRRARVTCLTGEPNWAAAALVTGPDTGDQILEPGQSLAIRGAGRIVIEALSPARFETTA